MSDISKTLVHATAQVSVAMLTAPIIDSVFWEPGADMGADDVMQFLRTSGEVILQTGVTSLLVAFVAKSISKLDENGFGDPAQGFVAFGYALEAQPNLKVKIGRIANYVRARFTATTGGIEGAVDRIRGIPQTSSAPINIRHNQMGQRTPATDYSN